MAARELLGSSQAAAGRPPGTHPLGSKVGQSCGDYISLQSGLWREVPPETREVVI